MYPFSLYLPTRIFGGENCIDNLPAAINSYGKNILVVYGGGSVKNSGLLDRVRNLLKDRMITEFSGITPNPKISKVREGVKLCRDNKIDVILSLGGTSVLDCCKHIAAAVGYEGDPWDLVKDPSKIGNCLPIFAVMTMSATGSEYDGVGVTSNEETHEKLMIASDKLFPVASFLDPTYTYTVSDYQTASGAADIISHVFEQYFVLDGNPLTDGFAESMLRTVFQSTPVALKDHENYEARYNLMLASAFGCGGLLAIARAPSPWPCHAIEHELSAWYDITHGAGLAIIIPHWMRYSLNEKTAVKFAQYGYRVWNIQNSGDVNADANKAIEATADFFRKIGIPASLKELDSRITDEHFEKMADHISKAWWDLKLSFAPIDRDGIVTILRNSL
ncbi:MAG: iron-containing alcohol dehydrogenase [Succinivibrio dextrinosolvens]|nr:iron-containing alcohol dehydrogenase [Succinivibrio dextrinosolvens]MDY6419973.1 iron-containing alcohol dehydrogenase [Succinivibrio dextrinosolvens]MDY6470088.1 iron-containing alcohol dehydrogenase [Succinivibrio dextrinosolvens]